jgi:hypothetical protein
MKKLTNDRLPIKSSFPRSSGSVSRIFCAGNGDGNYLDRLFSAGNANDFTRFAGH